MPQTVKNTGKKVVYAGKARTVYQGTRGGLYVKKDGKYVSISKKTMMGGDMTEGVRLETEKYAEQVKVGRDTTGLLHPRLVLLKVNRVPEEVNKEYLIELLQDSINNGTAPNRLFVIDTLRLLDPDTDYSMIN